MRVAWLLLIGLCGCVGAEGKGDEEEVLDDTKADSQRTPTDHGAIAFDAKQTAALTETERYHAWEFELSGDADVQVTTSYAVLGQRRTDTVLYLYKESETGWGRYLSRNDDYADTTYSQIKKSLGAGHYRALVKGYKADTHGKFGLTAACTGAGCTPVATNACLFGATYGDIEGNAALSIVNAFVVTAANLDTLSPEDRQHLVVAVQQSAHTDVTTPEEAISRVDQGEINVRFLIEPAARRRYVSFEYGAGDNSYGAIFERAAGAMVTRIHDGDLEACTVSQQTCVLPEDWQVLRTSGEFTKTASRVVHAASELSATETQQALDTFARSYGAGTTVAGGLGRIDDGALGIHTFTGAGQTIDVLEFGAGDTSVGTIYQHASTTRAGVIEDLFITDCAIFK